MWCGCCVFEEDDVNGGGYSNKNPVHNTPNRDFRNEVEFEDWETLIKEYDNEEESYFSTFPADVDKILQTELRRNPKSLLQKGNLSTGLIKLAHKRIDIINICDPNTTLQWNLDDDADEGKEDEILNYNEASSVKIDAADRAKREHAANTKLESLSSIWESRLAAMTPTQGTLKINSDNMPGQHNSVNSSSSGDFSLKQKWPEWLVDESFEVIKVNSIRQKFQRYLKLTQLHVLASSRTRGITKIYTYNDIGDIKVDLTPGDESLTIEFKNDQRSFMYLTPMAAHISHQITTRIQVRRNLDNNSLSFDVPSLPSNKSDAFVNIGYNANTLQNIMLDIGNKKFQSKASSTLAFAEALVEKLLPYRNSTSLAGDRSSLRIGSISSGNGTDNDRESDNIRLSTRIANDTLISKKAMEDLANHLVVVKKNSPEYFVQSAVQKLMFETRSGEFNTRAHFIESVNKRASDPGFDMCQEVRAFMEGMHEYILTKRGASLATIFIWGSDANVKISKEDLSQILDRHLEQQAQIDGNEDTEEEASMTMLARLKHPTLLALSYITFCVVEESVFLPLKDKIIQNVNHTNDIKERDICLNLKLDILQNSTQNDWEIPADCQSPLEWKAAIFELKGCETYNPSQCITAIVATAKAIFAEYEANQEQGKESNALGADDLVPIFIFVLCHSGLKTPLLNKDLLWSICHPSQLLGECGYYLTVYESAVAFVESCEIPEHL